VYRAHEVEALFASEKLELDDIEASRRAEFLASALVSVGACIDFDSGSGGADRLYCFPSFASRPMSEGPPPLDVTLSPLKSRVIFRRYSFQLNSGIARFLDGYYQKLMLGILRGLDNGSNSASVIFFTDGMLFRQRYKSPEDSGRMEVRFLKETPDEETQSFRVDVRTRSWKDVKPISQAWRVMRDISNVVINSEEGLQGKSRLDSAALFRIKPEEICLDPQDLTVSKSRWEVEDELEKMSRKDEPAAEDGPKHDSLLFLLYGRLGPTNQSCPFVERLDSACEC
jgi:hypothetical protein